MSGYAWVTLATNDSYSLGALVLAHSLKKTNTSHKLAVLITPAVSQPMRDQLQTVFDVVKAVNVLDSKDEAHLALLQRPELGVTFTKIHCWRLTEFEKCVFLDADTLVVRNCDELFERDEFSAAPDVSWPDCFNSGVFVYKPSIETFTKLLQFAVEKGSFDGGDQGLLNQFFSEWATEDIKKHLPFVYNLTTVAAYSYIPAFKQYGSDTRIVHFIGPIKPWLQQLDPTTRTITPTSGSEHITPLLQQWWDIFCEKVHPNLNKGLDFSNGMSHLPQDTCSNSYADHVNFKNEFTLYESQSEMRDCRQFGLPYQPFEVKGFSGEMLNVECLSNSLWPNAYKVSEEQIENIKDSCTEYFTKNEYSKNDERNERNQSDSHSCEDLERNASHETCKSTQGVETRTVREWEQNAWNQSMLEENEQKWKDMYSPFDYGPFFPDLDCINNYLDYNIYKYKPFNSYHRRNRYYYDYYNNIGSEMENEFLSAFGQQMHPLPRFLTMAHNDRRQSGNRGNRGNYGLLFGNKEHPLMRLCKLNTQRNGLNEKGAIPKDFNFDFKLNNHNVGQKTCLAESNLEENEMQYYKLFKSKSMSHLSYDSVSDSIWEIQTNNEFDPSKKYLMPKLKPILPRRNSFQKSDADPASKVTLYTELVISSDYQDPANLPKDNVGFVESQIVRPSEKMKRSKSDADITNKFGPLPYSVTTDKEKPMTIARIPMQKYDVSMYDFQNCKRQLGNKPKVADNSEKNGLGMVLPALRPLGSHKNYYCNVKKKTFSKTSFPQNDEEKKERTKKDNRCAKRSKKEKKHGSSATFHGSSVGNKENVNEILRKLSEYSKNYLHYFEEINNKNLVIVPSEEELMLKYNTEHSENLNDIEKIMKESLNSLKVTQKEVFSVQKGSEIEIRNLSDEKPTEACVLMNGRSKDLNSRIKVKSDKQKNVELNSNEKFKNLRNFIQDKFVTTQKGLSEILDVADNRQEDNEKDSIDLNIKKMLNLNKPNEIFSFNNEIPRNESITTEFSNKNSLENKGNSFSKTISPLSSLINGNFDGIENSLKMPKDIVNNKEIKKSKKVCELNSHLMQNDLKNSDEKDTFKECNFILKSNDIKEDEVTKYCSFKNCIEKEISKKHVAQSENPISKIRRDSVSDEALSESSNFEVSTTRFKTSRRKFRKSKSSYSPRKIRECLIENGVSDESESPPDDSPEKLSKPKKSKVRNKKTEKPSKILLASPLNTADRFEPNDRKDTHEATTIRKGWSSSKSGIAGAIAQLNLESGGEKDSTSPSPAHQEYIRRQNWETGNMDYMGRDSFDNIWSKICQTLDDKALKELNDSLEEPEKTLKTLKKNEEQQPVSGTQAVSEPLETFTELNNVTDASKVSGDLDLKEKPFVGPPQALLRESSQFNNQMPVVPTKQQENPTSSVPTMVTTTSSSTSSTVVTAITPISSEKLPSAADSSLPCVTLTSTPMTVSATSFVPTTLPSETLTQTSLSTTLETTSEPKCTISEATSNFSGPMTKSSLSTSDQLVVMTESKEVPSLTTIESSSLPSETMPTTTTTRNDSALSSSHPVNDTPKSHLDNKVPELKPLNTEVNLSNTNFLPDSQISLKSPCVLPQVAITKTPPTPTEANLSPDVFTDSKNNKKEEKLIEASETLEHKSCPKNEINMTPKPEEQKSSAVVPYCDVFQSAKNEQHPETPSTESEHRKNVEETIKRQSEVKSSQFPPIPLPESPTKVMPEGFSLPPTDLHKEKASESPELTRRNSRSGSIKEEGKQKKGMISKILEIVGVGSKEKKDSDSESGTSVFYDCKSSPKGSPKAEPKIEKNKSDTVTEKSSCKEPETNKTEEAPKNPVVEKQKEQEQEQKNDGKKNSKKNKGKGSRVSEETEKTNESTKETKSEVSSKADSLSDSNVNQKNTAKPKPVKNSTSESTTTKTKEVKSSNVAPPVPPKESSKKQGKEGKKNLSEKPKNEQKVEADTTAPEISQDSEEKNTVKDDSQSKSLSEEKVMSEIDAILNKAKTVVENQLDNQKNVVQQQSKETSNQEAGVPINTLQLITEPGKGEGKTTQQPQRDNKSAQQNKSKLQAESKQKKGGPQKQLAPSGPPPPTPIAGFEEVEELKVTSEEERKKGKSQTTSSKLSEQILKAIPPPRRKAISESKAEAAAATVSDSDSTPSSGAIPKKSESSSQEKAPSEKESEKSVEPSKGGSQKGKQSGPVPPPRNRSKPRQQQQPNQSKGKQKNDSSNKK